MRDTRTLAAAIGFAGLTAVGLWSVHHAQAAIDQTRAGVRALRDAVDGLDREAAEGPGLEVHLRDLEAANRTWLRQLPPPEMATEEQLMARVQGHVERCGATIMNYNRRAPREGRASRHRAPPRVGIEEVSLSVDLEADFGQLVRLLNALEHDPGLVRVSGFRVFGRRDGVPLLSIALQVSTFRYLGA